MLVQRHTTLTRAGSESSQIDQTSARYIAPGQLVELTFKFMPGQIVTGRVESVLQAIATGQVQPSGLATAPAQVQTAPLMVRVALDDKEFAKSLPAGATGKAAIFTDRVRASHLIQRVILRQNAILNYVLPY